MDCMYRKWCVFIQLFFCLTGSLFSQSSRIDSLQKKLLVAHNDSNKVLLQLVLSTELSQSGKQTEAINLSEAADSLSRLIHFSKGEAKAFLGLGNIYLSENNFDKALGYYRQSLTLFRELNFQKGIAVALNNIGNLYYYKSDFKKALAYYDSSLIVRQDSQDELGVAMSYNNIGAIYKNYGSYVKGLDFYLKSLLLREKMKDKPGMATSYNNIGEIYRLIKDYPKAIKYNYLSIKINTEIGDKQAIGTSLNNLGIIFATQGDFSNAFSFFSQCSKIRKETFDSRGLAQVYNNIGNLYTDLLNKNDSIVGNFIFHSPKTGYLISKKDKNVLLDSALLLHHTAELLSEKIGDKEQLIYSMLGMGTVAKRRQDYSSAIEYLTRVDKIASENHFTKELGDANYGLYECYVGLKNYQEALNWYVKYKITQDSVNTNENEAAGIKFDLNYISEKKEALAKAEAEARERVGSVLAKRQQIVIVGLGSVLLLVFVFSFFLYRSYRLKKKDHFKILEQRATIESALTEKEALITEIHHRVKNNLQIISSMLNLQAHRTLSTEAKDELIGARERIQSMALIHALLYSRNQFQEIDISTYLDKLIHEIANGYSSPDKKIETLVRCEKLIFTLERAIPLGLIVNEIITNSFKHAFRLKEKGAVSVSLEKKEGLCYLLVTDDGEGIRTNDKKANERSMGTELIAILAEQLNGKLIVESTNGVSYSLIF
jgi:two-component sensor histidine kinase